MRTLRRPNILLILVDEQRAFLHRAKGAVAAERHDRLAAPHRAAPEHRAPVERVVEFLEWFLRRVPITPIWLCPLRLRGDARWPLYPIQPHRNYVNVGFWSSVPAGRTTGETNRLIEDKVDECDGHKSLYSESFYSPEDFARRYGGAEYQKVKNVYDPESRLLGLYAKAVQRQ